MSRQPSLFRLMNTPARAISAGSNNRPIVERRDLGFEFVKAAIDLIGQIVGLGVFQLERIELRQQDGTARKFLVAHLDGFASRGGAGRWYGRKQYVAMFLVPSFS